MRTDIKPTRRTATPPRHRLRRNLLTFPPLARLSVAPSSHAAPASRPPRGSAANPIRPRNVRPWVSVTDDKGTVVGERMVEA